MDFLNKEIRDSAIILWTSAPGVTFDGVDDYTSLPDVTLPASQIKFFCCPIDFRTSFHILRAIIRNWGRATVYIVKPAKENEYPFSKAEWKTQGRTFDGAI